MKIKGILVIFVLLLAIWLVLNNSLEAAVIYTGIGLAAFLSLVLCKRCQVFNDIRLTPKAFIYTIAYIFVFLWELIKSNFNIAIRVLTPSLPINPGIVKAKTTLKSHMARLILANSITLTPGTFTIDIIDDTLYIHCVNIEDKDMEEYAKKIIRKFEKYLEVLYG